MGALSWRMLSMSIPMSYCPVSKGRRSCDLEIRSKLDSG
jgi:hypothetical protein